jgi:tetratricopeptide (TPR) repeat protein
MHREGLTPSELRSWNELVQQGGELESSASYAGALQKYVAASKIDDHYAELEFRIARTLRAQGDFAGAREHYMRARDLDTLRFRADSRINDINRSVATSSGAELVDGDKLFSQSSPNGVTGSELVYEHVHMTPEGNYLLARAMFLQIASKLTPIMQAADVPSQEQCEQLLAFTPHDRTRLAREMLGRLQRPPFTNQLNHSEQMLRLSLVAETPDEDPNQTAAEYQWAIRRKPDDRVLRYNFGLFLFDYNRDAAVEQLRMSRPWDDFPVFTPDGNLL